MVLLSSAGRDVGCANIAKSNCHQHRRVTPFSARRGASRPAAAATGSAQPTVVQQQHASTPSDLLIGRRGALSLPLAAVAAAFATCGEISSQPARATPLAPLGRTQHVGGEKLTGLSVEEVKTILARDLREGQYFVTGDITKEVFADDCRFRDPTNDVAGLSRYVAALGLLFDPAYSAVRLERIEVTGPRTIEADWVMGGYLRFPWNPRVDAFEGHTIYTLNDEGLVQLQDETWSISGATALLETFTPTAGVSDDVKQRVLDSWRPAVMWLSQLPA